MPQVYVQERKESPLDTIMKGLTVASQIYGIKANMATLEDHKKKMERDEADKLDKERIASGKYNKNELIGLQKDYDVSSAKPQGVPFQEATDLAGSPLYISTRRKVVEPNVKEVAGVKGERPGTYLMDVSSPSPREVGFIPGKPEKAAPMGERLEKALSPGDKKRDQEFAVEYSQFADRGGYSDVAKDLQVLREAASKLETGSYTGPLQGLAPDFIRKGTNQEAINMREDVRGAVQKNLRLVLGAQFTEREGQMLLDRAFDTSVDEAENKRRIDNLIDRIEKRADQLVTAGEYFQGAGTLKGFDSAASAAKAMSKKEAPKPKAEEGTAYAAPAASPQKVPSVTEQILLQKARMGDTKAQEYLKSLGY